MVASVESVSDGIAGSDVEIGSGDATDVATGAQAARVRNKRQAKAIHLMADLLFSLHRIA